MDLESSTKVAKACSACRRRKTRCEFITENGCHRCQLLKTPCSLATEFRADHSVPNRYTPYPTQSQAERASRIYPALAPISHHSISTGTGFQDLSAFAGRHGGTSGQSDSDVIRELNERSQRMEAMLQMMSNDRMDMAAGDCSDKVDESTCSGITRPKDVQPPVAGLQQDTATTDSALDIVTHAIGVSPGGTFEESTISQTLPSEVFEQIWQHFRETFNKIIPLPLLYGSLPRHPFLKISIAYFTVCSDTYKVDYPTQVRTRIMQMMARSVAALDFVQPDMDTIFGLVILSHSPVNADTRLLAFIDPYNAAMKAQYIAEKLGLAGAMDGFVVSDARMYGSTWYAPKILKICLVSLHRAS